MQTDRDRLINLIINAKRTELETGSFCDYLAEFLLAHGVMLPTLTPNESLTLEQLREMDGEPVYDYLGQEWYVIQEYYDHELTMTDGTRFFDDDEIDGVDKRFYRRPPEGEEDT